MNDEGWCFEAVEGFADEQMDEQMDRRTDGWTDEQTFAFLTEWA